MLATNGRQSVNPFAKVRGLSRYLNPHAGSECDHDGLLHNSSLSAKLGPSNCRSSRLKTAPSARPFALSLAPTRTALARPAISRSSCRSGELVDARHPPFVKCPSGGLFERPGKTRHGNKKMEAWRCDTQMKPHRFLFIIK